MSKRKERKEIVMYYWKQTDWNEYTLIGMHDDSIVKFRSYESLWHYCQKHNINATLV